MTFQQRLMIMSAAAALLAVAVPARLTFGSDGLVATWLVAWLSMQPFVPGDSSGSAIGCGPEGPAVAHSSLAKRQSARVFDAGFVLRRGRFR